MNSIPERPSAPLQIGISQCLLGDEVRYDGTGARSSMPHAKLQGLFQYQPICPEVGIGMSTPRDPIRLVSTNAGVRVRGVKDPQLDVTDALREFASSKTQQISNFAGYIFMHNSPSCGLFRVKVYPPQPNVPASRQGRGEFATQVLGHAPNLPAEDAGRLFDDEIRENFVTRAFAYAHWQSLPKPVSASQLVDFSQSLQIFVDGAQHHGIPTNW